jgi:hypothetical protein
VGGLLTHGGEPRCGSPRTWAHLRCRLTPASSVPFAAGAAKGRIPPRPFGGGGLWGGEESGTKFGAWLSPVERCVRVAEVPGSNPGAPTVGRFAACGPAGRAKEGCRRWSNGPASKAVRAQAHGGSNPSPSVGDADDLRREAHRVIRGGPLGASHLPSNVGSPAVPADAGILGAIQPVASPRAFDTAPRTSSTESGFESVATAPIMPASVSTWSLPVKPPPEMAMIGRSGRRSW